MEVTPADYLDEIRRNVNLRGKTKTPRDIIRRGGVKFHVVVREGGGTGEVKKKRQRRSQNVGNA